MEPWSSLQSIYSIIPLFSSFQFKAGVENILFLLLQGESFDNIGSSRLVYDMQNGAFPFDLDKAKEEGRLLDNGTQPLFDLTKVKFWLELGQLAPSDKGLFLHAKGDSNVVNQVVSPIHVSNFDIII